MDQMAVRMARGIAKRGAPGKGNRRWSGGRPGPYMNALFGQGVDMRLIIVALAAVIAMATAAMLMGLKLDLQIAQFFYDPVQRKFLAATNPYVGLLRENGLVALVTCASTIIAAGVTRMLRLPQRVIPGRIVLFLVSTLALGPGLLANVILKDHWHRPRPVQVVEFGGSKPYVDWWDPRGGCERNCSFVSGEASAAAWMFAPAM